MNIVQAVTGEVRACINAVPKKEWSIFFQILTKQETDRLGDLDDKGLTALQDRVKLFKELEHGFTTLREQST